MSEPVNEKTLLRWAESLAGVARTGLGFTQSQYERERFEEILKIASDIKVAAQEGIGDTPDAMGHVEEWMRSVGSGVPGYATPKVAVGAAVTNNRGELLLIQRADSGLWLYPTGWCDIGYSAPEVVVKEVEEETGIEVEPIRLIGVLDGLRLGTSRIPLYSLLFFCRRQEERSNFIRSSARTPVGSTAITCPRRSWGPSGGPTRSLPPSTASTVTCTTTRSSSRVARRVMSVTVETVTEASDEILGALHHLVPQLSRSATPLTMDELNDVISSPVITFFVARDETGVHGTLTLAVFRIPSGVRAWIEDVIVDEGARGSGVGEALTVAAVTRSQSWALAPSISRLDQP